MTPPARGIEVDEERTVARAASGGRSLPSGPHVRPAEAGLK
ncbi:hypothetical protein [Streptomyces ardesiacus]|nr:hypothetical protein [Streptomyces sp. NBRC 110030]